MTSIENNHHKGTYIKGKNVQNAFRSVQSVSEETQMNQKFDDKYDYQRTETHAAVY